MIVEGSDISFRQSWLDTAFRCPEEGRRAIIDPVDITTDEAIIGTGAHWAIEQVIDKTLDPADIEDGVRYFFDHVNDEEFRFTKRESLDEIIDYSQRCARAWVDDLSWRFPLEGAKTEVAFKVKAMEYRGYNVYLKGTVDLAPTEPWLGDWKTSGSEYKQKEKQKWATQPTVYGLAAVLGGIRPDVNYTWPITFKYGVMIKRVKKCRGQVVEVQRTAAHAAFLVKRIKSFIDLYIDFGLDRPWPLVDEKNYLCSAKWCDYYGDCRGKYITTDMDLFGWDGA